MRRTRLSLKMLRSFRGTALPYILLGEAEAAEKPEAKAKFSMAPFAPSQRLDIIFLNPAPMCGSLIVLVPYNFWLILFFYRGTRIKLVAKTIANAGPSLLVAGEVSMTPLFRRLLSLK